MATIEQRIHKADQALAVLNNEAFQEAFEAIEKELTEAWTSSPARDAEGREKIYLSLQATRKLKQTLTSILETGKLAMAEKMHQQSVADKMKEMWPFSVRS